MTLKFSVLAVCLMGGLAGCISVLPDPAPAASTYRLSTNIAPVESAANPEIVRIDRPASSEIFNTRDIVVITEEGQISNVALSKWSDVLPVMIQGSFIDALTSSPHFIGLVPASGARTQTRIHLTIKNFEANFDNGSDRPPLILVDYDLTYANAGDREFLGTYNVRKTYRSDSINVASLVNAFQIANDAAMSDIVSWLETQRQPPA